MRAAVSFVWDITHAVGDLLMNVHVRVRREYTGNSESVSSGCYWIR